jgi:O-succinylbenzoate synthase
VEKSVESPPLRIERIVLHRLSIPLVRPFRISSGDVTIKDCVLLEGHSGGLTGWGEVTVDAVPVYTPETCDTAQALARRVFAPLVLSRSWSGPAELAQAMSAYRGHHFTKAGFEAMFWDLYGQAQGRRVSELLGGTRTRVEVGPCIGLQDSPEAMAEWARGHAAAGARRIKIKVAPGRDTAFIGAVREACPLVALMVDANSAYSPEDMEHLVAWDRFGLMMIEQPFDENDLCFHAELAHRMNTPVCLDETIGSVHLARCALAMKAADVINIKVGRVSGLVATRKIHDLCAAAKVPVWIGSRLGTAISRATDLAAASLPHATYPSDAAFGLSYLSKDIVKTVPVLDGCTMEVPSGPGLGVHVDRERLESLTVECEQLK